LDWANDNYDLVIIDTPPVLAVTDASIVGALAGASIMVVKHQVTSLKEINFCAQRFAASGVQIKGVILNQMVRSSAASYGAYSYYQYDYKTDAPRKKSIISKALSS
jgi:tyrosine-protein kinase Etk/Wzc